MASDEAQATDDASLARVRRQLEREPGLKLDLPHTPTFRVTIEQRRYMLTFDEWLHKEFDLNPFQRQWLEYTQKASLFTPYGVDLLQVYDRLDRLSQQVERRKAREQIAARTPATQGCQVGAGPTPVAGQTASILELTGVRLRAVPRLVRWA